MNPRRRQMMANALAGGNPLTGGFKSPPVTRGTPGMSNPIAFGQPPVASGAPGASNPIAFQQNAQRTLQGGGFQPPAPTLPPAGGGMANPMAMGGAMPGGPGMPARGNMVQPPAMQNPMVRPGLVQGFQGGRQPAQPMSPRNTLL